MKQRLSRMTAAALTQERNESQLPVLPSVEALTSMDDGRLLAELELYRMLDKLARLRALVARAHAIVVDEEDDEPDVSSKKYAATT